MVLNYTRTPWKQELWYLDYIFFKQIEKIERILSYHNTHLNMICLAFIFVFAITADTSDITNLFKRFLVLQTAIQHSLAHMHHPADKSVSILCYVCSQ